MEKWEECSEKIKKKLQNLNMDYTKLSQKYGEDIELIEAMLSGNIPYNDRMNEIASEVLGYQVNASKDISRFKIAFRKDISNNEDDILKKELQQIFLNSIRDEEEIEKVDVSGIKDIARFKEYFVIRRPITIEEFLELNKLKDNFIIIKSARIDGISGATANIKNRRFIYINTSIPLGRQIFTFFHELYHIYFELSDNIDLVKDLGDEIHDYESDANIFAGNIIIDREQLIKYFYEENYSFLKKIKFEELCRLQQAYNCTFQCMMFCIDKLPEWIRNNNYNEEFIPYVPKIPSNFKKYYQKKFWDDLQKKIQNFDNNIILNRETKEESIIKTYQI